MFVLKEVKVIKLTKQADNNSLWCILGPGTFFESKTSNPGTRIYYDGQTHDVVESPEDICKMLSA